VNWARRGPASKWLMHESLRYRAFGLMAILRFVWVGSYYDPESRMLSSLPGGFASNNSLMLRVDPEGIK
jgi:hypothetical protein